MKLELNVKRFNNEDVIATSGAITYTISGFLDGTPNNVTFSGTLPNGDSTRFVSTTPTGLTYQNLFSMINMDESVPSDFENYNGTYTWNQAENKFVHD